jgi:hypothetical protein
MNQILGIGILFVFLFPLYFVYKDFKRQGFVLSDALDEYFKMLLFGVTVAAVFTALGSALFLTIGG